MATTTLPAGTRTAVTATGFDSLASATYAVSSTINLSSIDPVDLVINVTITPGTVSGDKAVFVYLKTSTDNTNWSTGPESGTSDVNAGNLHRLGTLYLENNSTQQSKDFGVPFLIGFIPPYSKVVIKNSTGTTLAASGNAVAYTAYTAESV